MTAELPSWTLGLLLGGASQRMGRDKALLPWGDGTLAESVCAACLPGSGQVLLAVGRSDRPVPKSFARYPQIYDRRPGQGPLAAIEVLLETCISPWLIAVPCDMLHLKSADLEMLLAAALEAGADIACFTGNDRPETFPLALRVEAFRGRCGPIFEAEKGRVMALADLGTCGLIPRNLLGSPEEADRKLMNLNRPEDLERILRTGSESSQLGDY